MKKIFLVSSFFLLFSFSSCEKDEGLDPLPTIVEGQFVKLDITNRSIAFSDLNNTYFGGLLTTPSNKIVKYELFVRYTNSNGIIIGNYIYLKTITSFPSELKITAQELATALNMNVLDFKQGDSFRFLGYSYDVNGNMAGYNNLSSTVKTQSGMKQGYKFITKLVSDSKYQSNDLDNYEL